MGRVVLRRCDGDIRRRSRREGMERWVLGLRSEVDGQNFMRRQK